MSSSHVTSSAIWLVYPTDLSYINQETAFENRVRALNHIQYLQQIINLLSPLSTTIRLEKVNKNFDHKTKQSIWFLWEKFELFLGSLI